MISFETRKLLLKLILVSLYVNYITADCESNKQLYSEIGCKPIYHDGSSNCPVAYDCENVFTRSTNKCYLNGNVYEPLASLSKTDAALNPCLAACFCQETHTYDNKTVTKFTCANVECPSYFKHLREPCYYQYSKDSCCEVKKYCPEEKAIVHECTYNGNTYKNGERFHVGDFLQCVCTPEFDGNAIDKSCRKLGCKYEILYMENILKRNAPVYFEKVDGCVNEWYDAKYNTVVEITPSGKSSNYECKYGDHSLSLGQQLTITQQTDSDTYNTTCSCNIPPLVTCVKVRK
ncbi:Hypothetical protein CINCED_3A008341 [Cinara cedri]|nr:Hypothetical protein CINCED_3A008341 [Cinara cedri]